MATLVATSPPPLNMDSVFAQGHAPPSPAYSSHPTSPISPKYKDEPTLRSASSTLPSTTLAVSTPGSSSATQNDASLTAVFRGDAQAPVRPAKDLATFNSLLPPPVEFVEGSSSGAFVASLEGRYEPINVSPKAASKMLSESHLTTKSTPTKKPSSSEQKATLSLHPHPIELSWPLRVTHGSGLYNIGNTCFLNSALQCLLHTPPLLRMLLLHRGAECRVKSGFCMSCAMRQVMLDSFEKHRAFTPIQITRNINLIGKHFRKGRQEDAHEFLRYAIDALQKSCLAGYPPKIDHKLAETTWVHKVFGGRLRSRVTCHQCGYNSDTFDSILDLSVDIYNMDSLKEALKRFTAKDYLKGADKYKCEKCKRPVNAEKQFTIHEAPTVLTVHLKRFTPLGRKLQHPIRYDERLNLQPVMSEGQHGPTYTLYGVISHLGSGPNHGHYFAHVRGADGQWYEMNDESVERSYSRPLNMKNAYMLFYIREKGQALAAAVLNTGLVNGTLPSKKRKGLSEDEEDVVNDNKDDKTMTRPFIPPHDFFRSVPARITVTREHMEMWSFVSSHNLHRADPQSDLLRRKIEAVEKEKKQKSVQMQRAQPGRPQHPPKPLVEYEDESDEEEQGERVERPNPEQQMTQDNTHEANKEGMVCDRSPHVASSSPSSAVAASGSTLRDDGEPTSDDTSSPGHPPPPTSPLPATSPAEAVSPSNFYGSSTSSKRKSLDGEGLGSDEYTTKGRNRGTSDTPRMNSTSHALPSFPLSKPKLNFSLNGGNPFGKSRIGDNLHTERDEERELFRPRKIHKKQFGSRNKFSF